jgi:hypothetical protein
LISIEVAHYIKGGLGRGSARLFLVVPQSETPFTQSAYFTM